MGKVNGKKRIGRSPLHWPDQVREVTRLTLPTALRQAIDREEWKDRVTAYVKAFQERHDLQQ